MNLRSHWSSWARRAVLLTHTLLIIALPVWIGLIGVLLAAPLLLPLPGLWRGRAYTYAACSLLLVFYAGGFLMEAVSTSIAQPIAVGLATVAVLEFCALLLFVRFKSAESRVCET